MKLILLLIITTTLLSNDWSLLSPSPTCNNLNSIYFVNNNLGFVVGDDGVLGRTYDGGKSWEKIIIGVDNDIKDILFLDSNRGFICGSGGAFYKTLDGGDSWISIETGINNNFRKLYLDQTNLWCCGEDLALFSYDIETEVIFDKSVVGYIDQFYSSLLYFNGDLGFMSVNSDYPNSYGALLRTENRGKSWDEINPMYGFGLSQPTDIEAINDSTFYLSIANSQTDISYGFICKSNDYGKTWETIGNLPTLENPIIDIHFLDEFRGYALESLYFSAKEHFNKKEMEQPSLYYTEDGGNNWKLKLDIYSNYYKNYLFKLNVLGSQNLHITGEEGIFLKSIDGGETWGTQDSYNIKSIYDIFTIDNVTWICGQDGYVGKSNDGGKTFITINQFNNEPWLSNIFFTSNQIGYIPGKDFIYKTTDGGNNWLKYSTVSEGNYKLTYFYNDQIGWLIKEGGGKGNYYIAKTIDGGESWNIISHQTDTFSIKSLAFSNELLGWAIILDQIGVSSLYQTEDGGVNWTKLPTGNGSFYPYSKIDLTDNIIKIFPYHENNDSYILISDNQGNDWSKIFVSDDVNYICEDIVTIENQTIISILNSDHELIKSVDGKNWEFLDIPNINNGLFSISFIDKDIGWVAQGNKILKTTTGGGVDVEEFTLPEASYLSQNYPNPFNPTTTINYSVDDNAVVALSVYNYKGELVNSLINKRLKPGSYSSVFDGRNLSSGLYLYTLKFDGKVVDNKKMVIIK